MAMLHVISLGAGVQSTTMALMAAKGEITPRPDCAIFADTGWEPRAVYAHLDWLERELPFPVVRTSLGNLREDQLTRSTPSGGRIAAVPWFMVNPDGTHGMGPRQCTSDYKLRPIMLEVRRMLGGTRKGGCSMWIGISTDEIVRMRDARVKYIVNRFPLIDLRFSRQDCKQWLLAHKYTVPPKSSCIGCPFHSDAHWRQMKETAPDEWADAVEIDKAIRNQPGIRGQQYMHAKRIPLDQVDLRSLEDCGQLNFLSECEGLCGV